MESISERIAGLPAPVRHFLGILIGALVGAVIVTVLFICGAIVAAQGISGLDFAVTWRDALDAGFVALAASLTTALGGVGVLAATPLTDAYGLYRAKEPEQPGVSPYALDTRTSFAHEAPADGDIDDGSVQ